MESPDKKINPNRVPVELRSDFLVVGELCNIDHGLTDWEVNFVESVVRQVQDERRPLSPRQREVAEAILDRRPIDDATDADD